ncbi:DEAD/DEAH box helicase [Tissierella sp. Yu-01]|uniref:DEAD/DEAH box helicase n=1 Tax=Tissierella sp. Yu-01 TaxID=3035694 RepID=UPI00240E0AA4|nr:DEAD/DEAH box helicase [Tissierella sp. Yu-01]WFA09186.1 DEAD/DEAH box helicase [Tissierella sp. Yu-01]
MSFKELKLIEPIQRSLLAEGYSKPTPIQEKAIPALLEGKDLLGCAQTGTGKTAAFAIPILQQLSTERRSSKERRLIKALIVAPTRELAIQISDSFKAYGRNLGLKTLVIYGGVTQHPQTRDLASGVDILVATPGRLLDLINQRFISLKNTKYFVLDEADLMLDMGMLKDVRKIITYLPKDRQTMFFSATMPTEIGELANSILNNPIRIDITPVSSTVDIIDQEVYFVDKVNKINLLIHILKDKKIDSALVFSRTKHGANKIVSSLEKIGLAAQAIHGNKSQNARQLALNNFKERKTRILIATDIAARGIDIEELSHVINFDLPEVPETYVHRIGRTGRAGLGGKAISFCDYEEKPLLRSIQKLISKTITEVTDHPYPLVDTTIKPKGRSVRGAYASNSSRSNTPKSKDTKTGKIRREKRANEPKKKTNGKNVHWTSR